MDDDQSKDLKKFIEQHCTFWWWLPEAAKENLSLESIVEATINYGDLKDIKQLLGIVGIKKVAEIFYQATQNRQRMNYSEEIVHYFTLYFKRYA